MPDATRSEKFHADGKILQRVSDGVGVITFKNPENRNAMSLEMWEGLDKALAELHDDPGVRVVILTGAGGKALSITDVSFRPLAVSSATARSPGAMTPLARKRSMAAKGAADAGSGQMPSRAPSVTTQRAISSFSMVMATPLLRRRTSTACTVPSSVAKLTRRSRISRNGVATSGVVT